MSFRRSFRSKRSRSAGRLAVSRRSRGKMVRGYSRTVGTYGRFNRAPKRVERKYFDISFQSQNPGTLVAGSPVAPIPVLVAKNTPTLVSPSFMFRDYDASNGGAPMTHLLQIPTGAGPSMRIGRKVFLRSMEIIGRISMPPLQGGSNAVPANETDPSNANEETHHLWVVLDKQVNGVGPGVNALFQPVPDSSAVLTAPSVSAFHNLANPARFRVLKHVVTPMRRWNAISAGMYQGDNKDIRLFLKLGMSIEYDNSTGGLGELTTLRDNGIFIITANQLGSAAVATTGSGAATAPRANIPTLFEQYHIRFRYTDV